MSIRGTNFVSNLCLGPDALRRKDAIIPLPATIAMDTDFYIPLDCSHIERLTGQYPLRACTILWEAVRQGLFKLLSTQGRIALRDEIQQWSDRYANNRYANDLNEEVGRMQQVCKQLLAYFLEYMDIPRAVENSSSLEARRERVQNQEFARGITPSMAYPNLNTLGLSKSSSGNSLSGDYSPRAPRMNEIIHVANKPVEHRLSLITTKESDFSDFSIILDEGTENAKTVQILRQAIQHNNVWKDISLTGINFISIRVQRADACLMLRASLMEMCGEANVVSNVLTPKGLSKLLSDYIKKVKTAIEVSSEDNRGLRAALNVLAIISGFFLDNLRVDELKEFMNKKSVGLLQLRRRTDATMQDRIMIGSPITNRVEVESVNAISRFVKPKAVLGQIDSVSQIIHRGGLYGQHDFG